MFIGVGNTIPKIANLPGASRPGGGGGGGGGGGLAQIDNLNSMSFDGINDSINCGITAPLNTAFTKASFSLWAKTTTWTNSNFTLFNNRPNSAINGFALNTYALNLYAYIAGVGNLNIPFSSSGFIDGEWNHILLTIDITEPVSSDRVKFYINGGNAIKRSGANPHVPSTNNLLIGDGLRGAYNGEIDEFAMWDVTLTEAEALSIYNATAVVDGVNKTADLSQLTTPPTAWYRM